LGNDLVNSVHSTALWSSACGRARAGLPGVPGANRLPAALRFGLAAACVLAALVLIGGALTGFRRAGTPAEPWQASTAIVTDGVYGYTRNPMYVAMAIFYGAIALATDSLITLLLLAPLLVVVHYGVVLREERYLESKFGDAYRRYKAAVRRWIWGTEWTWGDARPALTRDGISAA
jgi:protein-S-isoprenylcysteine O-methyltransferase Ste14